ncbi:MAG: hypothetical protein ABIB71_07490, partial [Candidatus Woesearchaeota archaeon]
NGTSASSYVNITVAEDDESSPIIEFISPEDGEEIAYSPVYLRFKVYDASEPDCRLSLYEEDEDNGGFYHLLKEKDFESISNGTEKTQSESSLEAGNYMWKVACNDSFGNSATTSDRLFSIYSTIRTVALASEEGSQMNSSDFESNLAEINRIIAEFDSLGVKEKEFSSDLGLDTLLARKKRDIENLRRDFFNVKFRTSLNEEDKEKQRQSILANLSKVLDDVPASIRVLSSHEFVNYDISSDLGEVSEALFAHRQVTLEDKDMFGEYLLELQNFITVSTRVKAAIITYYGGEEKTITSVTREITISNSSYSKVLEVIPKELAQSASGITFISDHVVIKNDPIIEFDIGQSQKYTYYFKGEKLADKIKGIDTLLISEPESFIFRGGSFITGLAVLGGRGFGSVDYKLMIAISIALTLLLLVAYSALSAKKKKVTKNAGVEKLLKEASSAATIRDIDTVLDVYSRLGEAYSAMKWTEKGYYFNKIGGICHDINLLLAKELIADGYASMKLGDYEGALGLYEDVQQIYEMLPDRHKGEIFPECNALYSRISAGLSPK